jgi:hypothetical protein
LGFTHFPWKYEAQPVRDGVVISPDGLPGSPLKNYNLGMTAVHETGHWFGLYHTFQGGCEKDGDFVDDTPAQKYPTDGCPSWDFDSCPGEQGVDAIHNYMDYSSDVCLTEFTAGQKKRMHESFRAFRMGL